MRKSNSSHSSGRPNRNSNRSGRSQGNANNNGNANRKRSSSSNAKSRNHQATQAWLDPTAITSHIGRGNGGGSGGSGNTRDQNGNKRSDSRNQDNTRGRGKPKSGGGKNRSHRNDRNSSRDRNAPHRNSGSQEKRQPAARDTNALPQGGGKTVAGIEPFDLFCAYHLGITRDKTYKQSNINEVARRFNADPGTIKQALKEYDMAPESLFDRDFDMALAQLDIQVAPEGVDRVELARGIYQDFQDAPRVKRDWKKIIEEDRKENQKVFRN